MKRHLHGINVDKVRTHSFRGGSVSFMKNTHGSSKLVGAVAGMTGRRVDQNYDEITPARVSEAQGILEPFINVVRCHQLEATIQNNTFFTKQTGKKKTTSTTSEPLAKRARTDVHPRDPVVGPLDLRYACFISVPTSPPPFKFGKLNEASSAPIDLDSDSD